ncbi:MAG: FecR family protein [Pyrinomonadaceae bacterium]
MLKRMNLVRLLGAALVLICGGLSVLAQSPKDSFVIYAKAGRINQASGEARVRAAGTETSKILTVSDELNQGDVVTTGDNARLEVLLSPGSYFRLANQAQFTMSGTSLEDIRVFLTEGSAVVETGGGPDEAFRIQVATPSGTTIIEKRGIYRLNVTKDRTEMLVLKGEALARPAMVKVKGGKMLVVNGKVAEPVAKFDKKAMLDELDDWSRTRAEFLAKANRSLDQRDLSRALNSFGSINGFSGSGRMSGYWLFSRRLGFCLFMPFDPWDWSSPYGFGYNNGGGWWPTYSNPNTAGNGNGSGTIINTPIKVPDTPIIAQPGPRSGSTSGPLSQPGPVKVQ